MYKIRRRLYSQNNLVDPKLVEKLIRYSTIDKFDTVIEIGPGKGIITQALSKYVGKVIAVEKDPNLVDFLNNRFAKCPNISIHQDDFLKFNLPAHPYKVFANIPFIITADIVRELTADKNFREGYLVVQKEAARKFIGKPVDCNNSMMSTLLKPFFEIRLFWKFERKDFFPRPGVDVVMIVIKRKAKPAIPGGYLLYRDFVHFTYNKSKVAGLDHEEFIGLYHDFLKSGKGKKKMISYQAAKLIKQQRYISKIHRTRNDRNWKKYAS